MVTKFDDGAASISFEDERKIKREGMKLKEEVSLSLSLSIYLHPIKRLLSKPVGD